MTDIEKIKAWIQKKIEYEDRRIYDRSILGPMKHLAAIFVLKELLAYIEKGLKDDRP